MIGLLLAAAIGAGASAPMLDEDVVRMLAAGRSPDEIVRAIETREVQFDLSDEMLVELRSAGVPERVLDAMRARQARSAPPPPAAKPAPAADPRSMVSVQVLPARPAEGALWFPAVVEDSLAQVLQLGTGPSERKIADLAVFVACTTPDHVPDQWRSRSPLGRDFISMPRHELLALRAGAVRVPSKEVPRSVRTNGSEEWLRLDLPVELAVPLMQDVAHDLVAGIAILVGETYLAVASGERPDFVPGTANDGLQLAAGRGEGRAEPLAIRFVAKDSPSP